MVVSTTTVPDVVFLATSATHSDYDSQSRDIRALQRKVEALGTKQDSMQRTVTAMSVRQESMQREVERIGEQVEQVHTLGESALTRMYEAAVSQQKSQEMVTRRLDSIQAMLSEIMVKVPA